jgi:hypothetical protein
MESVIVDEHAATCPIVVKGEGPRLVIYLHYNDGGWRGRRSTDVEPDRRIVLANDSTVRSERCRLDETR